MSRIGPKGLYKPPGMPKKYYRSSKTKSSSSSSSYKPIERDNDSDFSLPEKKVCFCCRNEIYDTRTLGNHNFCKDCYDDVKEAIAEKVKEAEAKWDKIENECKNNPFSNIKNRRLKIDGGTYNSREEHISRIVEFECLHRKMISMCERK